MIHVCPHCAKSFHCLRLWSVVELAEFLRCARGRIIRLQDAGKLGYRLKFEKRGRMRYYCRVTDTLQLNDFIRSELPTVAELEPPLSETHKEIIQERTRRKRAARLAVEARRRLGLPR